MVRSSAKDSPEIEINVHSTPPQGHPPSYDPDSPQSEEWIPWFVPLVFIINVTLFIMSMYINNCPSHSRSCIGVQFLQRFAFENIHENPLLGPATATLLKMGALDANKVIQEGQRWRIFTCMWLHAGIFHIFANMLSLLGVGIRLEQEFGFLRIGLLYIVSGLGGSLLSSLFLRKTVSVGASGALFGLLGAMLSELLTNWTIYANKLSALTTLILMVLINLMVGILPHVDNFAHIGGFITGFFLGFILLARPQFDWIVPPGYYGHPMKPQYKFYQYIYLGLSIIALFVMFTIGFVFLFRKVDGNEYCSWCHYLTCVPTPLWSCDPQCNSIRIGNQLNLTCLTNGKSKLYLLPQGNDVITIEELCSLLCI
ncbi:peptidase S54, rhomboid [Artemisia annua]|uniref:RHOMBOID-like protein n=1 Tax=Artemisia annua TaxID=35608 RepID=A0A2U1Q419_ARTAN|nr:peptidase S54, rhomboid [Artemisia annua]